MSPQPVKTFNFANRNQNNKQTTTTNISRNKVSSIEPIQNNSEQVQNSSFIEPNINETNQQQSFNNQNEFSGFQDLESLQNNNQDFNNQNSFFEDFNNFNQASAQTYNQPSQDETNFSFQEGSINQTTNFSSQRNLNPYENSEESFNQVPENQLETVDNYIEENNNQINWQNKYPAYHQVFQNNNDTEVKEVTAQTSNTANQPETEPKVINTNLDTKENKNSKAKEKKKKNSILPIFNLILILLTIAGVAVVGYFGYQEITALKSNQGISQDMKAMKSIDELIRENIAQQSQIQDLENKIDEQQATLESILNTQRLEEKFEISQTNKEILDRSLKLTEEFIQKENQNTVVFQDLKDIKEKIQILQSSSNESAFLQTLEEIKIILKNLENILNSDQTEKLKDVSLNSEKLKDLQESINKLDISKESTN
jgi:hypothetical protein